MEEEKREDERVRRRVLETRVEFGRLGIPDRQFLPTGRCPLLDIVLPANCARTNPEPHQSSYFKTRREKGRTWCERY